MVVYQHKDRGNKLTVEQVQFVEQILPALGVDKNVRYLLNASLNYLTDCATKKGKPIYSMEYKVFQSTNWKPDPTAKYRDLDKITSEQALSNYLTEVTTRVENVHYTYTQHLGNSFYLQPRTRLGSSVFASAITYLSSNEVDVTAIQTSFEDIELPYDIAEFHFDFDDCSRGTIWRKKGKFIIQDGVLSHHRIKTSYYSISGVVEHQHDLEISSYLESVDKDYRAGTRCGYSYMLSTTSPSNPGIVDTNSLGIEEDDDFTR